VVARIRDDERGRMTDSRLADEGKRKDLALEMQRELEREFLLEQLQELSTDFADNPEQIGIYLADLEVADRTKSVSIFIADWAMQQQILNGGDLQFRQLRGPFPTHTHQGRHRPGKRGHFSIRRDGGHLASQYKPRETRERRNQI